MPFSYRQKKKEKKKKATMNLPSHLRTETGERTDSFFKKKKKERNECFLSDAEEEKRTENVLFSFPFIMKQKERTHSLSPFREEERKSSTLSFPSSGEQTKRKRKANVTFPSSFFPLPQTEWRISPPFPEKRKKEKDEKTEERRQKEEGQKQKGTERREKEKEARERKLEKRQRKMSQKGAFLTQESRKGAGRGFRQDAGNGGRERYFSPHDGNAGRTAHLPAFPLPIRISKHGRSGTQNQPVLPPLPRHHAEALPSPIVDVSSFSYVVYFNAFIWYHIHVTKEEKRRKKKC